MDVAVLGGGLQGCCIALSLAAKGARVTLLDRNDALMSRAAVINEGKIHLGYMYGGDRSMATARTMITGALAFGPFLARHLEIAPDQIELSAPATYVVHRQSQQSVDEAAAYFSKVHELLCAAAADRPASYFGLELRPPRALSRSERDALFEPTACLAAFETPESAINPVSLAAAVRRRLEEDPAVEIRLGQRVVAVSENLGGLVVHSDGPEGRTTDRFDHVVNALWDGRLAIDATLGFQPKRPWLHRFKYGVRFRTRAEAQVSATIVLGPFGEVVNYRDGAIFLTWYPTCLLDRSNRLAPPDWPMSPAEPLRSKIIFGTFEALAKIVPALRNVEAESLRDASVAGGVIVAWGETDIDDPQSELHQRFAIGVTSTRRYHSVDPGKLTMIPHFATVCAERIAG
jgi:glycine/D-amino acid oxidase-like deaminating enzyme